MAFILKDRVKENSTTTGTGNISLGGASATFDTFQSYLTNGDTTFYAIAHTSSGVDEWEVGLGTWNTGNTLSRTTVLAGSNGTSAVNLSAGTKDIFMTYPASKAAVVGEDVTFADITVTGTVDGRDVAADGSKLDGIDTSADVTDAVTVAAAGALMRSGGTMTGNLILNADPNAALGAATKQYVDTIASAGIHYHAPVRAEHPSNLNATYNNGSSGVGATLTNAGTNAALVIDSVSMVLNDRVLVANQTNQTQNGVYTVTTVGDGSTAWVLTRSTDTDTAAPSDPDAFGKGDAFFIKEGSTNAGHLDVLSTSGTIVFGTTNIVFSEVAETTVYSGGTGITLTGTTFSIGQDVATSANVTFNQVTAAIIGNVTGNLTGDVTGNADTATALETARTIQLSGDVTGSASFDGSANINITAAVQDDSHAHVISNVDGLQSALDAKVPTSRTITAGNGLTGGGDLSANRTLTVGGGSGITVNANDIAIDSSYTGFDGRYYTETEADSRFVNVTGDTITGHLGIGGTATDASWGDATHGNTEVSIDGGGGYGVLHFRGDGAGSTNTRYSVGVGDSIFYMAYDDVDGVHRAQINSSHQFLVNEGSGNQRVFHDGYHPNADKWTTARTLSLSGDASGSVSWDGSANATLAVTVANDSHSHSNYLTSNADDTTSGIITFGPNSTWSKYLKIGGNGNNSDANSASIGVTNGNLHIDAANGAFGTYLNFYDGTGGVAFGNGAGSVVAWMGPDGDLWKGSSDNSGSKYWHAGNDGSGSGLDADLLDGIQGTSFLRSDANDIASGSYSFTNSYNEFGNSTGSVSNDGSWNARLNLAGSGHARLDVKSVSDGIITTMYSHTGQGAGRVGTYSNHPLILMTNAASSATLSTSGSLSTTAQGTLWGASNDGSGSGLDADLLDGYHESSFVRKGVGYAWTATGTNKLQFRSENVIDTASGSQAALEVFQDNANHDAFMAFHVGGDYAAYFGLHGGINDFVVGGWSKGATYQRVFHDGYHPNADILTTARTINGVSFNGSANITIADSTKLPLAGGTMTGSFNLQSQKINFVSGAGGTSFGSNHYSMGVDYANGAWTHPNYSDLIIGYHTGIRLGASYTGIRFYNNSPTTDTNNTGNGNGGEALIMTVGGTQGNHVNVQNNLTVGANATISGETTISGGANGIKLNNSDIRSAQSNPTWTGNPGPYGKIQYHSNRWYIVADQSSNRIVQFRRDGADKSYIDNNGDLQSGKAAGWITSRTLSLTGAVTGSVSWDGTGNASLSTSFNDNGPNYIDVATGNFGTVKVDDDRVLAWAGYAIRDDWVFMASGADQSGIYNDTDNEWAITCHRNADTRLYHNGLQALQTVSNTGIRVGSTTSSDIYMQDTDQGERRIHCNTNRIGFLNSSNGWGAYCEDAGHWVVVGNITATGNVNSQSDVRVKENIEPILDAMQKVQSINGVTFNRNDLDDIETRYVGVIAQDVEAVLPEAVSENDEGIKQVAYGNMVGLLIEAIKEQQTQIDDLKAEIQSMKS